MPKIFEVVWPRPPWHANQFFGYITGRQGITRDAFSDKVRKILPIPSIIDGYNTSMNIVD